MGGTERSLSRSKTLRVPWGHYLGSGARSLHEAGVGEGSRAGSLQALTPSCCVSPPSHSPSLGLGLSS